MIITFKVRRVSNSLLLSSCVTNGWSTYIGSNTVVIHALNDSGSSTIIVYNSIKYLSLIKDENV